MQPRSATLPRVAALVGAAVFIVTGLWAFFAPRSFYDVLATWPPYHRHFLHDLGAFQIGIGAVLAAGAFWRDALLVALFGGAVGSAFHFVSHVMDRGLGGQASDPYTTGALAAVLVAAAAYRKLSAE